jgi:HAAS domain-containing protein
MQIGEVGEARIRGYLFVLDRSLRSFLPAETARDAVQEVHSHIRERVAEVAALPDERSALEAVLSELGPPLKVARAYALEATVDQALVTGRLLAVGRALGVFAARGVLHFLAALVLFTGYSMGASFVLIALMKPLFPGNVGLFRVDGRYQSFGVNFGLPPGTEVLGGYWIVPACLAAGAILLIGTHALARHLLARWRERRVTRRPLAFLAEKSPMV